MGYHITILRTDNGKTIPISKEEIETFVSKTKELRAEYDSFGNILIFSSTHSESDESQLIWRDGEIWSKTPGKTTIRLMIDIADRLQARVRGDELETYRTPDETYIHDDDKEEFDKLNKFRRQIKTKIRIQKILLRFAVVAIFIFLAIVLKMIFKF